MVFKIILGVVGFVGIFKLIGLESNLTKPDVPEDQMSEEQKQNYHKKKETISIIIFVLFIICCGLIGLAKV